MTVSRKTSLYENHKKLGAKLIPFSGFLMPLQYSSIIEEHKHVRSMAGIFDVSHIGEFIIKGDPNKDRIKCNDLYKEYQIWIKAQFNDGKLIDPIILAIILLCFLYELKHKFIK